MLYFLTDCENQRRFWDFARRYNNLRDIGNLWKDCETVYDKGIDNTSNFRTLL